MMSKDTGTKNMIKKSIPAALAICCWLAALFMHASLLLVPISDDTRLIILSPAILLLIVISALAGIFHIIKRPAIAQSSSNWQKICVRVPYLHFLILAGYAALLPLPVLTGLIHTIFIPAFFAWVLLDTCLNPNQQHRSHNPRTIAIVIFLAFTFLHALIGIYYTDSVGEHSGDEGHYLVQARSLYEDRDLDLRNQFADYPDISPARIHISPNSRDGKWYSWHSPGLSFLLAPTVPYGIWFRHIILGLISGLTLAGMYLLAIQFGASQRSSLSVTILLGISIFWVVYAARALPEILGAGLATWGLLFILAQDRWPWKSCIPLWAIIGFLPWVQTRFIPVALLLWGLYGLHMLQSRNSWPHKFKRGAFFTAGTALVIGFHQYMQFQMFEQGLAYPVPNLLFSLPVGLWHTLASQRGIVYMLPVFLFSLPPLIKGILTRENRQICLDVMLLFLSIWLTSCATRWFSGGASMPGRFLLITIPPMLAYLAKYLPSSPRTYRACFMFAAMYAIVFTFAQLSILPNFGKSFTNPLVIRDIHPLFPTVFQFYYEPYSETRIFPVAMLLIMLFGIFLVGRRIPKTLSVIGIAVVILTYAFTAEPLHTSRAPRRIAYNLESLRMHRWHHVMRWGTPHDEDLPSLFDITNRMHDIPGDPIKNVTARDLGELVSDEWLSAPHLPANDWEDRDYRWATLIPPFQARRNLWAVRMDIEVKGETGASLAIREGDLLHEEIDLSPGHVQKNFFLQAQGRGDIYILARLHDQTEKWITHEIAITRVSDPFLRVGFPDMYEHFIEE